jgi:hypothetical protein
MILRVQSVAFIDDFSICVVVSDVHEVLSPVNHTHIDEMVCVPAELAKLQCAGPFQSIGKRLSTNGA